MANDHFSKLENIKGFIKGCYQDLPAGTLASTYVHSENTNFYRFNRSQIRQASNVEQSELFWKFRRGAKQIELSFDFEEGSHGQERMVHKIQQALARLDALPELSNLPAWNNQIGPTQIGRGNLPSTADIELALENLKQVDCAGLLMSGQLTSMMLNSLGMEHQFTNQSFVFDYSLYSAKQKAVKQCYSGTEWVAQDFLKTLKQAKHFLSLMDKENKTLVPGKYRVYLAPECVEDLLGLFNWNGLSFRSLKMGTSALLKHFQGEREFSDKFNLKQNFDLNLSPRFNSEGEVRDRQLDIIRNGKVENWAVSSRSASEYGVAANFASNSESFECMELRPGTLPESEVLNRLGTGLYLSNLHYLNWSDSMNARVTGMTRFACFWVEDGKIIAPIKDLRFDESLYHIFGEGLLELTCETKTTVSNMSYDRRSLGGKKVPGALVENFTFTL